MLLAFGALWLFLLAVPAFADGGPHIAGQGGNLTPDSCAGCHRAHSAVAANLLVRDQMSLCYTCHGASATGSVLDVVDGISTASIGGGALRGGGVQFALLNTTTYTGNLIVGWGGNIPALPTGVATSSHHSVDASAVTMWGNGPTPATVGDTSYGKAEKVNLSCGSCHDPHGNHQYRILKPGPSDSGIANGPYSEGVQAGRVRLEQDGHLVDEGTRAACAGAVHPLLEDRVQVGDLRVLAAQLDDDVGVRQEPLDGLRSRDHLLHEGRPHEFGHV